MEQIFTLQITPMGVDSAQLRGQVSRALEKRTELESRQKYPKMWEVTDRLNRVEKVPEAARQNRKRRRAFLGFYSWLLGVVFLVPALIEPQMQSLMVLTGAGCFAVGCGILWCNQRRRLSMLNLTLGMILCLGALGDLAELKDILAMGLISIASGSAALSTWKRERENPFDRAAGQLLQELGGRTVEGISVSFTDRGMYTDAAQEGESREIPYEDISVVLETEDLIFPVYRESIAVLQKKDLRGGSLLLLREFLGRQTAYICIER